MGVVGPLLLRAVADALDAGLAPRALVDDPALAPLLPPRLRSSLRAALARGDGVARALADAGALDAGHAAVVRAGEDAGFLPRALRTVAEDLASSSARRRRALFALAYPAFLVVMASVILPLPLVVTRGVAGYARYAAPGVVTVAALLFVGFVVVPRLPAAARSSLQALLARVPIYGAIVVDTARGAALEALGRLLAAGVPVTSALAAAVAAGGLSSFDGAAASTELGRGGTLAAALSAARIVDDALAARVALAERTGKLDTALPALAEEARTRARARFVALSVAAGLACFLAVAAAIAAVVIHGAQSYFQTIDDASKE